MIKKIIVSILFFIMFLPVLLIQNVYAGNPDEKVTSHAKPTSDEMMVYVILEGDHFGPYRDIQVACNDKVITTMQSGNYCCFKVKSGLNVINLTKLDTLCGFYILKFSPGETVYLLLNYSSGLKPISTTLGEKLISKDDEISEQSGLKQNKGYESLLMNPALINFELIKKSEEVIKPDSENAVITFIRSETYYRHAPFGVWSEEEYVGTLIGKTYFQLRVKPGKHFFIVKYLNTSVISTEVAAGKTYYIEFSSKPGFFSVSMSDIQLKLNPLAKEVSNEKLQQWLETFTRVGYDKDKVSEEMGILMDKAKLSIQDILDKVAKGKIKTTQLLVKDAR